MVRITVPNIPAELHELPSQFRSVPYRGSCYPGAPGLQGLAKGANCQHYAYELLRHYGLAPPNLRSSELFADSVASRLVTDRRPLDLLLYNGTEDPYGAHVAVYLANGKAVHLSKEIGVPAVWPLEEFTRHDRYRVLVGIKRIVRTTRDR